MNQPIHNELKKEFQLERMIFFSDAVFAIAITLLIIDIKVPDFHEHVSNQTLLTALANLIPKFIGFLISFMLIGLYWTIHHRMFGFVTGYNKRLITLNLAFLFFIVLLPFSTGFYSEYAGRELIENRVLVPLTFYVCNFAGAGIINFFMWWYIGNPKNKLAEPAVPPLILKAAKIRSLVVPFIFLCMIPIAYFISPLLAVYVPLSIAIVNRFVNRGVLKKTNPPKKK